MSKIKIQGSASGTGTLTIQAPTTATNRTLNIPDSSGTLLDENSSLPAANLTGTVADARISALTASKLTGNLPAISGAALTNLPSSNTGKILQTVYVENDTDVAFPQNTSLNTTIVSAAITPTATSSKILIYWCYRGELNGGNYPAVHLALNRGGSSVLQVINYVGYFGPTATHRMLHTPGFCQDSPNTTSSVTYYLDGGNTTGSSFSGTYGGHANGNGNKSNILLVEVGA
tara:strand:+ start:134 stop:826 length:693 start_codon:yes stop_codon:yes gene_type:complete